MAFWHDARKSKDPKRQYRWVLTNDHIPSYTLKSVSKPSFSVTQTEHQFLNHSYHYPGRLQWNTVSMTLVDVQMSCAWLESRMSSSTSGATVPPGLAMGDTVIQTRPSLYFISRIIQTKYSII